jgi:hypothetical protein
MKANLLLVVVAAAACAFGGEKANDARFSEVIAKLGDLGKASAMRPKASTNRDAAVLNDGSSVRMVVAASQTVQPGDTFDSGEIPIDFGGAENLAVAMSSPSDVSAVGIAVAWAAPGDYDVLTDLIMGGTLTASRVPVYGSGLRILVTNVGKTPITIKQLSIYACIH